MGAGDSFWNKVTAQRISRRRALQMTAIGGASAGAIAIVGCGGGSSNSKTPGTTGSPAAGTTSVSEGTPKPGGTLHTTLPLVTGKDPHTADSFIPHAFGSLSYSRLMRFKTTLGVLPQADRYTAVPELIAKIENPDPLTYIFTLRSDVKFHNVPPTNGRPLVAQDIVNSYQRYTALSPNKGNFTEIVDSLTASADGTQVTFKLKSPFGLFLNRVASYQDLWIIPQELVDAKQTEDKTVGSGPFIFESFEAGKGATWRRNPDYFEKDAAGAALPYVDGYELILIPDPNQVLSQFAAGQLDTIFVDGKLVASLKSQSPNALIDAAPRNILNFLYFEPATYTSQKPPFNDERVRQGMSRAIDRDGLLNLTSPDKGKWPNMPINPGFSEYWWLDPQGKDIGTAGQYYQYDVAEAKKLFAAAGVDTINVPMHFSSNVYTIVVPYYETLRQALPAMLKQAGVTTNDVPEEYNSVYIPKTFQGQFDGFALGLESVFSDVGSYWTNMFYPRDAGGGRNHSSVNDTTLNDRIKAMLQLQSVDEIRKAGFDLQTYLSEKMYYVPVINPVEYTARQPKLKGVVNTQGPTTYSVGTEGALTNWFAA
jgi:peptide/nickel transport system substrate-binding protein